MTTGRNMSPLIKRLDGLFRDLPDDWDLLTNPEEVLLGVPEGTLASIFREIEHHSLWEDFFELARHKSDQWKLDLSEFIPNEESFVLPRLRLLQACESDHALVCLAIESDDWAWTTNVADLLPLAVELVSRVKERARGGSQDTAVPALQAVINRLKAREQASRRESKKQ